MSRHDHRDDELDDEIRHHLELEAAERMRAGETREQAERTARKDFGNELLIREIARQMWGPNMFETLIQDVRYALRVLRKSPALVTVAVLSLALGIGANTAIFTLVNAVFLKPLPVQQPSTLVALYTFDSKNPGLSGTSYPNFEDYRDKTRVFSSIAAYQFVTANLASGAGDPMQVTGEMVSGAYFSLLGIEPQLGRGFLSEEDRVPGKSPVVVLSNALTFRFCNIIFPA